jgi:hypothetical protein
MGLMDGSLHSLLDEKSFPEENLNRTAKLMLNHMLQALVRNTNVFASVCAGVLLANRYFDTTRNQLTLFF